MKLVRPRELANRSLGLVATSVAYVRAVRQGSAPSPLLLVLRKANDMAEGLLQQPSPAPTPAQRRTLLAAAAQIRVMTRSIITTAEGRDPKSLEGELSALITRTLTLIEQVTAEPPAIETHVVEAPAGLPRGE